MSAESTLLDIKDLSVSYEDGKEIIPLLKGVSFSVNQGEILGVTGVSGSGKSLTALSIMGLIGFYEHLTVKGHIFFKGVHMLETSEEKLSRLRGKDISWVLQQPDTALNPLRSCGQQLAESITVHNKSMTPKEVLNKCYDLLFEVGLEDARRIFKSYPHQLSGGQIQRIVIAMALAHRPSIILCDEITSALDPKTSRAIIDLLLAINLKYGTSLLFITHDLALLRKISQRIIMFKEGRVVDDFLNNSEGLNTLSDYSKAYIHLVTQLEFRKKLERPVDPIIEVKDISKFYKKNSLSFCGSNAHTTILKDINLELHEGEILGVCGVSGSGKTTLGRIVCGLLKPNQGTLFFKGEKISPETLNNNKPLRRRIQMVVQDALGSLNPIQNIGDQLEEVIRVFHPTTTHVEKSEKLFELLSELDLDIDILNKRPYMLSGGQRQRVVLAKTLMVHPQVIVFDEALASLDVINQRLIIDYIIKLQKRWKFAGLFISHNFQQIKALAHTVLVIDKGEILAYGGVEEVLQLKDQRIQELLKD